MFAICQSLSLSSTAEDVRELLKLHVYYITQNFIRQFWIILLQGLNTCNSPTRLTIQRVWFDYNPIQIFVGYTISPCSGSDDITMRYRGPNNCIVIGKANRRKFTKWSRIRLLGYFPPKGKWSNNFAVWKNFTFASEIITYEVHSI